MRKSLVTILSIMMLALLTACGTGNSSKIELKYVPEEVQVQYTPIHFTWEKVGDQTENLPSPDMKNTELFNRILKEEYIYLQKRFNLNDKEISEVPVMVLTPQECEEILAVSMDSFEAVYNSFYRAVFMSNSFLESITQDQLIGIFAHEAVHAIYQQYNAKKTSAFCLTNSENGLLGFYLSEGFTQDLSNDFLEEYYPDARKVRSELYGFSTYVADLLASTLNAENFYLKDDIKILEEEFNKKIYLNTNTFSKSEKYSPFEVFLYLTDRATYIQLYAYSLNDAEVIQSIFDELAVWEMSFVTGRGGSNSEQLIQIYQKYDTNIWQGAFASEKIDEYFKGMLY